MLKLRTTYLFILLLGSFFSCEKEVVLDFESEEQSLAIYSLFSPNDLFINNQNFNVEVSSTQSILDNSDFKSLEDAIVTITSSQTGEPNSAVSEKLSSTVFGDDRIVYRTDNTISQDGYTYELKVEHYDYPTVIAQSFVPKITEINNVELSTFKKSKESQLPGNTRYKSSATIDIDNKLSKGNHYHLLVWLKYPNGSLSSVNIDEDLLVEQLGTEATIINFENSQVFFGAHFDDTGFNGVTQELNFDIAFVLNDKDNPTEIKIELRSVSQDYHKYFVEGFRQSQAGNNPFFAKSDNIPNNVENGYGVFAGYSTFDMEIPFRK